MFICDVFTYFFGFFPYLQTKKLFIHKFPIKNMIKKRELIPIIISIIIITLLLMFNDSKLELTKSLFISSLIISALIILVSVFSKKITSKIIDVKTEIQTWEFKRYWFATRSELKKPLPIGILLSLLLGFLSGGFVKFLALLQFKSEALPSKLAKKFGARRFSAIMDWDEALIAFYSTVAILILAIIAKIIYANLTINSNLLTSSIFFDLAKFSFYYCCYNLIPFSILDGSKIFYGSRPLYVFTLFLLLVTGLLVFL